ncbi:glycosyltransferase family 39 protein [Desulfonatronospira sp.]|uniref:ArnT family glycosyltransferase n=1 Tax=Desulfonatronospira sp. TaxID=1962951 RepID=UPI0025BFF8E2|nr:glycosyltransferase family 39 protein [Desulfonatronospira sp.]
MNYIQARDFFYFSLFLSLPLKLILAGTLPLTGDEAYFVIWAQHLAPGYYDHPPLIGWLIHLCMLISGHEILVRLPSILASYVLVWGVYSILSEHDRTKALLAASTLLFTPVFLMGVLVTTDTALILSMFLSVLALHRAETRNSHLLYFLSGILLGLAFLSKYFAALMLVAYVLYFFTRGIKALPRLGLVLMGCLPLAAFNLYWNYTHCWVNIMFNFFSRGGDAQLSPLQPLILVVILAWVISPVLLVQLFRHRSQVAGRIRKKGHVLFAFAALVPLAIFFAASLFYSVGAHWILGFVPFLYVLYAALPGNSLALGRKFMLGYALLHIVLITAALLVPLEIIKDRPGLYRDAVFYLRPAQVAEKLEPFRADYYATPSYSRSAVLSYYSGHYWGVLGTGSRYGREDDRITDFRELDGRDILFLSRDDELNKDRLSPYFEQLEPGRIQVRETSFAVALGREFDFSAYRSEVLTQVRKSYYDIPEFLPLGRCFFHERYFP